MTTEQQFANLNHLMSRLLVSVSEFAEESKASSQRVETEIGLMIWQKLLQPQVAFTLAQMIPYF